MPARVATARQINHIATQHVGDIEARHPRERLIGRKQRVVGVENHDTFTGGLEYRGRQLPLLFKLFAGTDVPPSADHAQHPTSGAAFHCPATVFDPDPMAIAMTDAVFDLVILAAAFQVLDQGTLQCRKILWMQARGEMTEHGRYVLGFQAKQLLELGVMDFIGLQVPADPVTPVICAR